MERTGLRLVLRAPRTMSFFFLLTAGGDAAGLGESEASADSLTAAPAGAATDEAGLIGRGGGGPLPHP